MVAVRPASIRGGPQLLGDSRLLGSRGRICAGEINDHAATEYALGAGGVVALSFAWLAELACNAVLSLAALVYDHILIFWQSSAFFPL